MPVRPEDFDASPGPPNGQQSQRATNTNTVIEKEHAKSRRPRQERSQQDVFIPAPKEGKQPTRLPTYVMALILMAGTLGVGVILLPSLRTAWHMPPPAHGYPVRGQSSQPPTVVHKESHQEESPPHTLSTTPHRFVSQKEGGTSVFLPPKGAAIPTHRPSTAIAVSGPEQHGAVFNPGNVAALPPPNALPESATAQQPFPLSTAQETNAPKLVHRPTLAVNPGATADQGAQFTTPPREEGRAIPAHVPPPYSGPSSGVLTWQGEVQGTALVVIEKDGPNFGAVFGSPFPGVLCLVQISDPKHFSVAVAPAPSNQWQRIILNVHGNGLMTVRLTWALP